ncbi:MAG: hypothetical protein MUQ30_16480, partial [Anaerolineae bacterium]|nr:hypothetical protein [Anaerolineae bacterium]
NGNQILSLGVAQFTDDNIPDLFTLDNLQNLVIYEQAADRSLTAIHSIENVDANVFGIDYANSTDLIYDTRIQVASATSGLMPYST